MSRLVTLLLPACLVVSACASPSSARWSGPASGSTPGALHLSADAPAEVDSGAWAAETYGPEAEAGDTASAHASGNDMFANMTDRHVTLLAGQRMLTDNDWHSLDDQYAVGLEVDGSDPDTGHGYEFGIGYSRDDDNGGVDTNGNTADLYGGYRHTFRAENKALHPYLSAGGTLIRADLEANGPNPEHSSDTSFGAYVRAGIGYDIDDKGMRLGLDYRHLFLTNLDVATIDSANFDQVMLTLGIPF